MNKYVFLENIANGIHAANSLKAIQRSTYSNSRSNHKLDNVAIIAEVLQSIARYSPKQYRAPLSDTSSRCMEYCNAYKNFKNYLNETRSPGTNKTQFVNSLRILEPVLNGNKKNAIAKIMKIYELFN